jgi:hypothetical protein
MHDKRAEIAAVDADHLAADLNCAIKLVAVVDFAQNVEAVDVGFFAEEFQVGVA